MVGTIRLYVESKINRSNARSTTVIKNIIACFGIKGISIIVQLLLVPMTIHYVNPTQYGIWLTLSSIISWLSFFDIGFGNGLKNRFAEAKATGNFIKAKAYISTTYICVGMMFAVVWALFFCLNFFLDWSKILNAPAQMTKELSVTALIIISFFCLQMVLKLINTVLIADQKSAKSAFFDMLGQILALAIIFVLKETTSGSLIYLAMALGFCPVVIMIVSSFWFYTYEHKPYSPAISLFDRSIVKDILSLGGKFFFIQISCIIIFQTNNIVIAQICGPESVTIYNIAYKLFAIVNMIFLITITPFWSAFTDAYTKQDIIWMKNVSKKLEWLWIFLCAMCFTLLFYSKFLYKIWIGDAVVVPFALSVVICFYYVILMRNGLYIILINGIGKIKLQLYVNFLLCLLNLPIVILFGKAFGLIGIVIGNVLISLPNTVWSQIQLKKLINRQANGIWNQ